MIGRDEPMAAVVYKEGKVMCTFNLGYATLDGNEYYNLMKMVERYGCNVQIEQADLSEVSDFGQLWREIEKTLSGA